MKTLISLLFLLCCANNVSFAQITIGSTPEKEVEPVLPYDSLSNICSTNIMSLKGQTLFIYGTSFHKENGFSHVFYTTLYTEDSSKRLKGTQYKETSKPGYGSHSNYTPYDAIAGKYYLIKEVIKNQYDFFSEVREEYNLLLEDQNTKENIYMFFRDKSAIDHSEGWLILGFYEKIKELYVGKNFKAVGDGEFQRYNSSEKEKVTAGTTFKCSDIAVNLGEYNALYAVLTNANSQAIRAPIWKDGSISQMMDVNKYNLLVRKYGTSNANLIIEKKVRTGMTKEMVLDSWGKPLEGINITKGSYGTYEQWCYGAGRYLYFENGKLTTIQE